MVKRESSPQICGKCKEPLTMVRIRKRRFCLKCRADSIERKGSFVLGKYKSLFRIPEYKQLIRDAVDQQLKNEVLGLRDYVSIKHAENIINVSFDDYVLERKGTIKQSLEISEEIAKLLTHPKLDEAGKTISGLILFSVTIAKCRLWKRYAFSKLRQVKRKGSTKETQDELRYAQYQYKLHRTSLIAGFGSFLLIIKHWQNVHLIGEALGAAAVSIARCLSSCAVEACGENLESKSESIRDKAIADFTALVLVYAPIKMNLRLKRGLMSQAKRGQSAKDVLGELLSSDSFLIEQALKERQPGEGLLVGWNSLMNSTTPLGIKPS